MTLSLAEWAKYRDLLSKLSQTAADEFRDAIWGANSRFGGVGLGNIPREDVIEYAYALVTKYGEGSSELACQMYDAMAEVSGMHLAPAVPAETASLNDVGRAINGTIKVSQLPEYVSATVGRLVKQASQDTTLQNALRDGAQFAWIPSGDTCPFCIMLASRGWQYVSKKTLKKGHAEHIHSNCNCAYSVRFNDKTNVAGYDPDKYLAMYEDAEGDTWKEKLNSMNRERLQSPEARAMRNAQRRAAYAEKKKNESASTENELLNLARDGNIFVVKTDDLYQFSRMIPPYEDYTDIVTHGDAFGVSFRDANGIDSPVNAQEFAEIIEKGGFYTGGKIRLVACNTGEDPAIVPQYLADYFGVEVIAPTEAVFVDRKGNITVANDKENAIMGIDTGTWRHFYPKR